VPVRARIETPNRLVDSLQFLRLELNESEREVVLRLDFARFAHSCSLVLLRGSFLPNNPDPALNLVLQGAASFHEHAPCVAASFAD
jgi:hypothetical protein